ncbi:hypothetical protein Fmac_007897 [Flemingia macrophylla]|uniref:RING-type E3 ubiquitin transferase n=1 Tax=Flemingia macrophylla TaxID=520843 RepID=A0ABD1MVV5_9FABA
MSLHLQLPRILIFLFYFYFFLTPPAAAQLPNALTPPPADAYSQLKFDKSMVVVLVILVAVFFVLGFLSVYTRRCTERRGFDLSLPLARRQRGLEREILETFPTFVYSAVKSLKIGRATLECAVCLNEFEEEETLRLIPQCSHVFHAECVDAWLLRRSTCPVCRATLHDTSFQPPPHDLEQPDIDTDFNPRAPTPPNPHARAPAAIARPVSVSPKVAPRSRSTFPRSHSTGHSVGESYERFTLRLPQEVRNQLLSRTTSCGVDVRFTRQSSSRKGYRTRSVGHSLSPHLSAGFSRTHSPKDDVGERSSHRLFSASTPPHQ